VAPPQSKRAGVLPSGLEAAQMHALASQLRLSFFAVCHRALAAEGVLFFRSYA